MSDDLTHYIKCRNRGDPKFTFLTPNGGTTNRRIHASMMTEAHAKEMAAKFSREMPGCEFKAALIKRKNPNGRHIGNANHHRRGDHVA